jgi:hypothetical protein
MKASNLILFVRVIRLVYISDLVINKNDTFNLTSMDNIIPLYVFSQCLFMGSSINTINKQMFIKYFKSKYSQNTTNLLSIVNVATCFDS